MSEFQDGILHPTGTNFRLSSVMRMLLQILEGHVDLSFHLQQQQLIELIRENKIEEALDFAEAFLAPIGEEHPDLLKELGELLNPLQDPSFTLNH